jgi:hypothetical protein
LHNADGGKANYRHESKKFGSHEIFLFPLGLVFGVAGPERAKNPAGKGPPPVSDPFSDGVIWKKSRVLVKSIRRKHESPIQDKRGLDLISGALPFGQLWYGETEPVSNAVGYAKRASQSHCPLHRERELQPDMSGCDASTQAISKSGKFCSHQVMHTIQQK